MMQSWVIEAKLQILSDTEKIGMIIIIGSKTGILTQGKK